jgi:hypothetical protein
MNNKHLITLSEAQEMTHAFQNSSQFQNLTKACMIDKNAYQQVIDQPGCVGLRTYFALNSSQMLTIVVVGVDENGNDLTSGIILNKSDDCPTFCANNSLLM